MAHASAAAVETENFFSKPLEEADPEIFATIRNELGRQRDEIQLIASENIVSRAVMEAQGTVLTNKYAEGYPGRRYYGGCQFVDVVEQLAIDRHVDPPDCVLRTISPARSAGLAILGRLRCGGVCAPLLEIRIL